MSILNKSIIVISSALKITLELLLETLPSLSTHRASPELYRHKIHFFDRVTSQQQTQWLLLTVHILIIILALATMLTHLLHHIFRCMDLVSILMAHQIVAKIMQFLLLWFEILEKSSTPLSLLLVPSKNGLI